MKLFDLTGKNTAVVGFEVDVKADGAFVGRLSMGKLQTELPVGTPVEDNPPLTDNIEIHFDKPESVAVFIHQLQKGYNKMGLLAVQERQRKEAEMAAYRRQQDQAILQGRIEAMAKELTALQNEYQALRD